MDVKKKRTEKETRKMRNQLPLIDHHLLKLLFSFTYYRQYPITINFFVWFFIKIITKKNPLFDTQFTSN